MNKEKKKIIGANLFEIDEKGRFIDRRHIEKHPDLVLPPDTFLLNFKNSLDNRVLFIYSMLKVDDADLQTVLDKRISETSPKESNATKKSEAQKRMTKKVKFKSGIYYYRRDMRQFRKLVIKALEAW